MKNNQLLDVTLKAGELTIISQVPEQIAARTSFRGSRQHVVHVLPRTHHETPEPSTYSSAPFPLKAAALIRHVPLPLV